MSLPFFSLAFLQLALFVNWAVVAAMTLYVVKPLLRNSADALQVTSGHLFGDAFSPYLVGLVSDTLETQHNLSEASALKYALLIMPAVMVLGGLAFITSARFVPEDR
eukprot:m.204147 g.204147  ORF g.204147 m.204147 type:complete len:107 (+) comp21993_c0_seq6:997-1317(+)